MPFKNPHELYSVWQGMRRRCLNPNFKQWNDYGGRGITICPEWDDFHQFVADMGPRPSKAHSLDRLDNDRSYAPSNCRWATKREQMLNRRITLKVEIEGREYLVADLAKQYGMKPDTIKDRVAKGMSLSEVTAKTRYTFTGGVKKAVAARVANQLSRTHCKNGHEWTPENTGQQKGGRRCKACHREKVRRQNLRKRLSEAMIAMP